MDTKQYVFAVFVFVRQMITQHSGKATRFIIVGVANVIVAYALYVGLLRIGYGYNLALVADYVFGTILGYVLNRRWTFTNHEHAHGSFLRYLATYVASFLLNGAILNTIVISGLSGPLLGQVFAIILTTMISFLLQMFWVFRRETVSVTDENQRSNGGSKIC